LLGGLIGVEVTKKILGVKSSSGDLMTFPIILALIIGRIGCFAEGLRETTFGTETKLFTGIDFGDGVMRHPLQLYEIAILMSLWLFLFSFGKKYVLKDGSRFKIFLSVYLLQRFLFEFLKPNSFLLFGFSSIQIACLAGMTYYYKVFLFPKTLIVRKTEVLPS
jgi:phosphatidylglycerol---prolipoprotein diacylglyceryl transferase